jgi:RNA polymerase sigma-70 factor (ECF subfamily)
MNSSASEKDLLIRARKFDMAALEEIYDRYRSAIYAYALRILGKEALAEDCASETFSRFLTALHAGKGPRDYLRAYLYRIAHNWITDYYRNNPIVDEEIPETIIDPVESYPEHRIEIRSQQHEMQIALSRLTEEQRLVVTLRFIEAWEIPEVAAALQKPPGAVKALQHRAIENLRNYLSEREATPDE